MSKYKKIPTSAEVVAVIRAKHQELRVYSSFSDPDGSFCGGDLCTMMTEWGFADFDIPFLGIKTTWKKHPTEAYKRDRETHEYWLCVSIEED